MNLQMTRTKIERKIILIQQKEIGQIEKQFLKKYMMNGCLSERKIQEFTELLIMEI